MRRRNSIMQPINSMLLTYSIKLAVNLVLIGFGCAQPNNSFEIDHTLLLRLNQISGYKTLFEVHPWLYHQGPSTAVRDYLVASVSNPTSWYGIDMRLFYEHVFIRTCAQLDDLYHMNRQYFDDLPTVDAEGNRNLLCRVSSIIRDCKMYRKESFIDGLIDAMSKTMAELMLDSSPSSILTPTGAGPAPVDPSLSLGPGPAGPNQPAPPQVQQAGPSHLAPPRQQLQEQVSSMPYPNPALADLGLIERVKRIRGYQILFEAHPWLFRPSKPVDAIKEYLIKKVNNPTAWIQVELKSFYDKFFVRACNELVQMYLPNKQYFDNLPTIHVDADTNLLCRVSSIVRDCIMYQSPDFGSDLAISLLSTVMELITEGKSDANASPGQGASGPS